MLGDVEHAIELERLWAQPARSAYVWLSDLQSDAQRLFCSLEAKHVLAAPNKHFQTVRVLGSRQGNPNWDEP